MKRRQTLDRLSVVEAQVENKTDPALAMAAIESLRATTRDFYIVMLARGLLRPFQEDLVRMGCMLVEYNHVNEEYLFEGQISHSYAIAAQILCTPPGLEPHAEWIRRLLFFARVDLMSVPTRWGQRRVIAENWRLANCVLAAVGEPTMLSLRRTILRRLSPPLANFYRSGQARTEPDTSPPQ